MKTAMARGRLLVLLALLPGCDWGPKPELVEAGRVLLQAKACEGCHSIDGTPRVGPSFHGRFGLPVGVYTAEGRRTLTVDRAYLKRSITEPDLEIVEGHLKGSMPLIALDPPELRAVMAAVEHLERRSPEDAAEAGTMLPLIVFTCLFVLGHLTLSGRVLRPRLVARLGLGGFQGRYSLLALLVLGGMIWAWTAAPYQVLWTSPGWTRYVPLLALPVVFVLMVAGFSTKSPTAAGQASALERENAAVGILTITRHPGLWANGLWATAHLPPNGDLAAVIFFGGLAALSFAGMLHIELRRRVEYAGDAAWARFAAQTSVVPFWAVLRGRVRPDWAGIGWPRLLAGLGAYLLALLGHVYLIGASPYPY